MSAAISLIRCIDLLDLLAQAQPLLELPLFVWVERLDLIEEQRSAGMLDQGSHVFLWFAGRLQTLPVQPGRPEGRFDASRGRYAAPLARCPTFAHPHPWRRCVRRAQQPLAPTLGTSSNASKCVSLCVAYRAILSLPELASLHSQLFGKLRVALSPMIGPAAMPTSRVASRTLGLGSPLLILLYGFYTPGFAERESSGIRQIPWRAIYRAVQ